jgi:hypothetical protein
LVYDEQQMGSHYHHHQQHDHHDGDDNPSSSPSPSVSRRSSNSSTSTVTSFLDYYETTRSSNPTSRRPSGGNLASHESIQYLQMQARMHLLKDNSLDCTANSDEPGVSVPGSNKSSLPASAVGSRRNSNTGGVSNSGIPSTLATVFEDDGQSPRAGDDCRTSPKAKEELKEALSSTGTDAAPGQQAPSNKGQSAVAMPSLQTPKEDSSSTSRYAAVDHRSFSSVSTISGREETRTNSSFLASVSLDDSTPRTVEDDDNSNGNQMRHAVEDAVARAKLSSSSGESLAAANKAAPMSFMESMAAANGSAGSGLNSLRSSSKSMESADYSHQGREGDSGYFPGEHSSSVSAAPSPLSKLDFVAFALADAPTQKQLLKEHLYPLVQERKPFLAKAITEFLVENADSSELLQLLEDPSLLLPHYITQALASMKPR